MIVYRHHCILQFEIIEVMFDKIPILFCSGYHVNLIPRTVQSSPSEDQREFASNDQTGNLIDVKF